MFRPPKVWCIVVVTMFSRSIKRADPPLPLPVWNSPFRYTELLHYRSDVEINHSFHLLSRCDHCRYSVACRRLRYHTTYYIT